MNLKIRQDGNSFALDQTVNMTKGSVYTTQIDQAGAIMHGLNEYAGGLNHLFCMLVCILPVNAYSTDLSEAKVLTLFSV